MTTYPSQKMKRYIAVIFMFVLFLHTPPAISWNPPPEIQGSNGQVDMRKAYIYPHWYIILEAIHALNMDGFPNWNELAWQFKQDLANGARIADHNGRRYELWFKLDLLHGLLEGVHEDRVPGLEDICNESSTEHFWNPDNGKGLDLMGYSPFAEWLNDSINFLETKVYAVGFLTTLFPFPGIVDVDLEMRPPFPPIICRSALDLMTEKYREALGAWKQGDPNEAFRQLGWACHLLADLSVTQHTYDSFVTHGAYEAYADNRRFIGHRSDQHRKGLYHAYSIPNPGSALPPIRTIGGNLAREVHSEEMWRNAEGSLVKHPPECNPKCEVDRCVASMAGDLDSEIQFLLEEVGLGNSGPIGRRNWPAAYARAIPLATDYTAALIARFMNDIGVPKESVVTGKVVDISGNGVPGAYIFWAEVATYLDKNWKGPIQADASGLFSLPYKRWSGLICPVKSGYIPTDITEITYYPTIPQAKPWTETLTGPITFGPKRGYEKIELRFKLIPAHRKDFADYATGDVTVRHVLIPQAGKMQPVELQPIKECQEGEIFKQLQRESRKYCPNPEKFTQTVKPINKAQLIDLNSRFEYPATTKECERLRFQTIKTPPQLIPGKRPIEFKPADMNQKMALAYPPLISRPVFTDKMILPVSKVKLPFRLADNLNKALLEVTHIRGYDLITDKHGQLIGVPSVPLNPNRIPHSRPQVICKAFPCSSLVYIQLGIAELMSLTKGGICRSTSDAIRTVDIVRQRRIESAAQIKEAHLSLVKDQKPRISPRLSSRREKQLKMAKKRLETVDPRFQKAYEALAEQLTKKQIRDRDGQLRTVVTLPRNTGGPFNQYSPLSNGLIPVPSKAGVRVEVRIVPSENYWAGDQKYERIITTTNSQGLAAFLFDPGTLPGRVRLLIKVINTGASSLRPEQELEFLIWPQPQIDGRIVSFSANRLPGLMPCDVKTFRQGKFKRQHPRQIWKVPKFDRR